MTKLLVSFLSLLAVLAKAQDTPTSRSCENTRVVFQSELVFEPGSPSSDQIFTALQPVEDDSQCRMRDTCCPLEVESNFKRAAVRDYRESVTELKSGLSRCRNQSILTETYNFILAAKQVTIDTLHGQVLLQQHFPVDSPVLDRFYYYLANTIYTGDVTDLRREMYDAFFTLYHAIYFGNNLVPTDYPDTEEFRTCFYNYFARTQGYQIDEWLNGFENSYNRSMRYFRALRVVDEVVKAVSRHAISEQCQASLLRLTNCVHCAGYPGSSESCNGLCMNTMRGCLLDLGDLVEPIREFSEVLISMKDEVTRFNVYVAVGMFNSFFNMIVGDTDTNFFGILGGIDSECVNPVAAGRRRKRQAGGDSHIITPRQLPPYPTHALNISAYCLLENAPLFSSLPESLCRGPGVSAGNSHCWNGRAYGNYTREVANYSRAGQVYNPEMKVCTHLRSQFSREISLLRYLTREMRSLLRMCSTDDEDCLEVIPTRRYYDLDAIDLTLVEVAEGTQPPDEEVEGGSGSGAPDEDEEEVCVETSIPVTTPPYVGPGEHTTGDVAGPGPVGRGSAMSVSVVGVVQLACGVLFAMLAEALCLRWS